jgi:murein L,D-transpeptidase YcbB/YkuD
MFPNELGIYLHDPPARQHFARADRRISNGCVRRERAAELYRWALGHDLPEASAGADRQIDLAQPLPVFLVRFSPAAYRALANLSAV